MPRSGRPHEPSPFHFPARPWDDAVEAAATAERLFRAALRRLTRREPLLRRSELAGGAPTRTEQAIAGSGPAVVLLAAIPWDYRYQRPQQLARALAAAGRPVLYVEAFLRTRFQPPVRVLHDGDGVTVVRIGVPGRPDPFRSAPSAAAVAAIAERLTAGLQVRPAAIVAQLPFWGAVGRELRSLLGSPLVYDRIDLHAGFPGVPPAIVELERELVREADLVAASSHDLLSHSADAAHTLFLPNAVALEDFPAADRVRGPRPRIGYVGALGPWFDADAVGTLAAARPDSDLVLVGRVEDEAVERLATLRNVSLVGEMPHHRVPSMLATFDVALIPFRDLPLTRAVDPVKLYEALAVGVPVVARALPELARWEPPCVYKYARAEDLVERVAIALDEDRPGLAPVRRAAVASDTWGARATTLLRELETLAPPPSSPSAQVLRQSAPSLTQTRS